MQILVDKSSSLIKSQSNEEDKSELVESDIPHLAENGNTKEIGAVVRTLEGSGETPNIRKILHYFAQSESERGKKIINTESREELSEVLNNIAQAFRLANEMDKVASTNT